MATHDYYATYCRYFTRTKDEAGLLLGADCCVGDCLSVEVEDHALRPEADLVNRFGAVVGHLNADMTQQVLLCRAKGWEVRALLASVYYTEPDRGNIQAEDAQTEDAQTDDAPIEGARAEDAQGQAGQDALGRSGRRRAKSKKAPGYWGEVVLMSFADSPAFRAFSDAIAHALGEGARPAVELGASGAAQVAASQGAWLPEGRVPKPEMPAGTAVVKDHLTFNEKMVEQARRRNPGCMAAGWVFIIVAVAAIVWLVLRILPF